MQSPLNRIEREYIFDFFKNEKPGLTVLQGDNFFYLNTQEYKLDENSIFFENKTQNKNETQNIIIPHKNTKIFFNYKNRPFYFFTEIIKFSNSFSFKFSDKIYKYQDIDDEKNMIFLLETSTGFKMKAKPENKFSLKYEQNKSNKPDLIKNYKLIESRILNLKEEEESTRKIPPPLIQKIYEMLKFDSKIKINTSLLFIDSKYILIFCSQKNANIISTSPSIKAEISFKERKIKTSLNYDFFYGIENKNILFFTDKAKQMQTSLSGILCLSIKKIHEEDRRFLYEYTYASKYGV